MGNRCASSMIGTSIFPEVIDLLGFFDEALLAAVGVAFGVNLEGLAKDAKRAKTEVGANHGSIPFGFRSLATKSTGRASPMRSPL